MDSTNTSTRQPRAAPPRARRNLFHGPSFRRQPSSMSTTSSMETLIISASEHDVSDARDMIERDEGANYKIAGPDPSLQPRQAMRTEYDHHVDAENHMISFYKPSQHWNERQNEVLPEIKAALASSLDKKVKSLDEDRWIFEGGSWGREA